MRFLALSVVALAVVLSGCLQNLGRPSAASTGDEAPVNLRQLQIMQAADGHRAVMLRLSRLPTLVRHSWERDPGRINIEAWGPMGDSDLELRDLAQSDSEISSVQVSRSKGGLTVTIIFKSATPPSYTVHEMADWIMVRLNTPAEQG